jgi:hypothetical protein
MTTYFHPAVSLRKGGDNLPPPPKSSWHGAYTFYSSLNLYQYKIFNIQRLLVQILPTENSYEDVFKFCERWPGILAYEVNHCTSPGGNMLNRER